MTPTLNTGQYTRSAMPPPPAKLHKSSNVTSFSKDRDNNTAKKELDQVVEKYNAGSSTVKKAIFESIMNEWLAMKVLLSTNQEPEKRGACR